MKSSGFERVLGEISKRVWTINHSLAKNIKKQQIKGSRLNCNGCTIQVKLMKIVRIM
jgi:hypothetical protein